MVTIVNGITDKPEASNQLKEFFNEHPEYDGTLFVGYPLLNTLGNQIRVDALWISNNYGLFVFDIVENHDCDGYQDRQDDLYNKIESRLKGIKELNDRRQLLVTINILTFAPNYDHGEGIDEEYPVCDEDDLFDAIEMMKSEPLDDEKQAVLLSVLQSVTSIKTSRMPRTVKKEASKGSKLNKLEDSIANLDSQQNRAVIETVDGVQRIRGLAGSGKTIVLALKAVYLHITYPEWRIAVTFNTRSLKEQFKRLITAFHIEQTNSEPDWNNLLIINAWGADGGSDRDGLYHIFCQENDARYHDYRSASTLFGRNGSNTFGSVCEKALAEVSNPIESFDAILVDEAQDFSPFFLRMCYAMLKKPKRLVYAYDELQDLNAQSLPSPEDLFGSDDNGDPKVTFNSSASEYSPERDIVLKKCYRNSRQVLITAHALGFGIYRECDPTAKTKLVQMFEQSNLWFDIGYSIRNGFLEPGQHVCFERTPDSSPKFLEDHSDDNDLLLVKVFDSVEDQNKWVADEIQKNLDEDELRPSDIIVIDPDPKRARDNLAPIRAQLFDKHIKTHMVGVDTKPDVFFTENGSIPFTGIYRAKGNEAAMVYVLNSQSCASGYGEWLAKKRNSLFTAITRSKGWVRVLGVGSEMEILCGEVDRVRSAHYTLSFTYPTEDEMKYLRIVNRDKGKAEKEKITRAQQSIIELLNAIQDKSIYTEDFDPDTLKALREALGV